MPFRPAEAMVQPAMAQSSLASSVMALRWSLTPGSAVISTPAIVIPRLRSMQIRPGPPGTGSSAAASAGVVSWSAATSLTLARLP